MRRAAIRTKRSGPGSRRDLTKPEGTLGISKETSASPPSRKQNRQRCLHGEPLPVCLPSEHMELKNAARNLPYALSGKGITSAIRAPDRQPRACAAARSAMRNRARSPSASRDTAPDSAYGSQS